MDRVHDEACVGTDQLIGLAQSAEHSHVERGPVEGRRWCLAALLCVVKPNVSA